MSSEDRSVADRRYRGLSLAEVDQAGDPQLALRVLEAWGYSFSYRRKPAVDDCINNDGLQTMVDVYCVLTEAPPGFGEELRAFDDRWHARIEAWYLERVEAHVGVAEPGLFYRIARPAPPDALP